MSQRPSVIRQTIITPIVLIVALLIIAALSYQFGSRAFNRTVVEMFINIMVVVGLYVFVGNSGLLSFGHISFMCLGAYTTAWLTIPPVMKSITLKGLPTWLLHAQLPMWVATPISGVFAALFALIVGRVIMRLSGIAASKPWRSRPSRHARATARAAISLACGSGVSSTCAQAAPTVSNPGGRLKAPSPPPAPRRHGP